MQQRAQRHLQNSARSSSTLKAHRSSPGVAPRFHSVRALVGLRAVALFEAAKGALVLLAGCGAFALLHHDAQHAAELLVRHFHLDPASHHPRIFLYLAEQATPVHLWLLAIGALLYALIRFVEAYGLWRERLWAEWLAIVGGGIYLPIEVWELLKGITWPRIALFGVNLAIVAYLGWMLIKPRAPSAEL